MILIYCFIFKFDYETVQRESSISEPELNSDLELESTNIKLQTLTETISDYYNYCREICTSAVRREAQGKIGGQGLIVEINEAKFGKSKYKRGHVIKGKWVLGGICQETNKGGFLRGGREAR